jgi:hypothetical protein
MKRPIWFSARAPNRVNARQNHCRNTRAWPKSPRSPFRRWFYIKRAICAVGWFSRGREQRIRTTFSENLCKLQRFSPDSRLIGEFSKSYVVGWRGWTLWLQFWLRLRHAGHALCFLVFSTWALKPGSETLNQRRFLLDQLNSSPWSPWHRVKKERSHGGTETTERFWKVFTSFLCTALYENLCKLQRFSPDGCLSA